MKKSFPRQPGDSDSFGCRVLTREQWIEHICDTLPPERSAIVARHIDACPECRQRSEQLLLTEGRLIAAAGLLRDSLPVVTPAIEEAIGEWRRQLSPSSDLVPQRLLRLELFLTPICGFRTAERAMGIAAHQALAGSVGSLTEGNWPAFVKNLSSLVCALCGEFTGDLLCRVGQTVA